MTSYRDYFPIFTQTLKTPFRTIPQTPLQKQPHDAKTPFMEWNGTGVVSGSEMLGVSKRSHEFIATHHTLHSS